MPSVEPATPRKMLPPPMTTASSTPACAISFSSSEMRVSVGGWMPYFPSPIRASPDSLRRMRLERDGVAGADIGSASIPSPRRLATPECHGRPPDVPWPKAGHTKGRASSPETPGKCAALHGRRGVEALGLAQRLGDLGGQVFLLLLDARAHLVADEAAHGDLLANLTRAVGDHLADLLLVVLHPELVHETHALVVLLHLAHEDLVPRGLGLALLLELLAEDLLLLLQPLGGKFLAGDVLGIGGGDVHGHLLHQVLEVRVAGDEVRLAVDLHEHADAAAVHVGAHQTLGGHAAGLARQLGAELLAQPLLGLDEVTRGLAERLLAIHQARAGLLAEFLHHRGADLGHVRLLGGPAPCARRREGH